MAHPENTRGALGSMLIGGRVPGRKLGPETSRGPATLVGCSRSSALNVEPRGGACVHINNVVHCCAETKLSMRHMHY